MQPLLIRLEATAKHETFVGNMYLVVRLLLVSEKKILDCVEAVAGNALAANEAVSRAND